MHHYFLDNYSNQINVTKFEWNSVGGALPASPCILCIHEFNIMHVDVLSRLIFLYGTGSLYCMDSQH